LKFKAIHPKAQTSSTLNNQYSPTSIGRSLSMPRKRFARASRLACRCLIFISLLEGFCF
jgi:hypothetical protein